MRVILGSRRHGGRPGLLLCPNPNPTLGSLDLPTTQRRAVEVETVAATLRALYQRDCRRSFCNPALWLAPAATREGSMAPEAAARALCAGEAEAVGTGVGVGAVLRWAPHMLPFELRVRIFRSLVRAHRRPYSTRGVSFTAKSSQREYTLLSGMTIWEPLRAGMTYICRCRRSGRTPGSIDQLQKVGRARYSSLSDAAASWRTRGGTSVAAHRSKGRWR